MAVGGIRLGRPVTVSCLRWNTYVVDGHDVEELCKALWQAKQMKGKPTAIVAKTFKGKGLRGERRHTTTFMTGLQLPSFVVLEGRKPTKMVVSAHSSSQVRLRSDLTVSDYCLTMIDCSRCLILAPVMGSKVEDGSNALVVQPQLSVDLQYCYNVAV